MLRDFGDLDGSNRYAGSSRAGFPGQEDAGSRNRGQPLPPLALADLVAETFWQQRLSFAEGFEQQATMLQHTIRAPFAVLRISLTTAS